MRPMNLFFATIAAASLPLLALQIRRAQSKWPKILLIASSIINIINILLAVQTIWAMINDEDAGKHPLEIEDRKIAELTEVHASISSYICQADLNLASHQNWTSQSFASVHSTFQISQISRILVAI
jgi:hypothetical protein